MRLDKPLIVQPSKISAKFINNFIEESKAIDAWRHLYPDKAGFTYRNHLESYSRLDYFLMSPSLQRINSGVQMSIGNWYPGKITAELP